MAAIWSSIFAGATIARRLVWRLRLPRDVTVTCSRSFSASTLKAVPVATSVLRNPRRAMILVALAGPAANVFMALIWCGVLAAITRVHVYGTVDYWVGLMAEAGIWTNVILAVFNLLPIPPLDGGRVLAGLLPLPLSARLEKIEPVGLFIVIGLSAFGLFGWLFDPTFRIVGRVIYVLMRPSA